MTAPSTPASPLSNRWLALDVVRGMTVAGMLLVNNPGTWAAVYPPLEHAPWHGWTPTDLVFPFFLFMVGITTELSLNRRAAGGASDGAIRRQIITRGALIVLFGLLLAAFPYVPLTRITGVRIPGVLQRIGVCYAVSAAIAWRRSDRAVGMWCGLVLIGYWAALTRLAVPGQPSPTLDIPDQTVAAYFDRLLLGGHLWAATKTWDPEGPLSTLGATATSFLGILAGRWIRRGGEGNRTLNGLFAAGCLAALAGAAWNGVYPINKNLWTGSYVVFTAGMALLVLGTVAWLIEAGGPGRWTAFFATFGRNPLVAFLGSGAMARLMGSVITLQRDGESVPIQRLVFERAFAPWLAPVNASLAFAITFVCFWWAVLRWFERRGWILRV